MLEYTDLLGVPFAYQGRGPDEYDCYGLNIELHRRIGVEVPDYKSPTKLEDIARLIDTEKTLWHEVWKKDNNTPREADIPLHSTLLFKVNGLASHVGMKISGNRFIHTWEGVGGVLVERISLWKHKILGVYQYDG